MRRVVLWVMFGVILAIAAIWRFRPNDAAAAAVTVPQGSTTDTPASAVDRQETLSAPASVPRTAPRRRPVKAVIADLQSRRTEKEAASAYTPPHQRKDPGVMGRLMGMRIRSLDEDWAEQRQDAKWTQELQARLAEALEGVPDTYLLSADCRETSCKVELIHEDELTAVQFNNELPTSPVKTALQDGFASFVERSEDDGLLKNIVYVERDGPGLKQILRDAFEFGEDEEPE